MDFLRSSFGFRRNSHSGLRFAQLFNCSTKKHVPRLPFPASRKCTGHRSSVIRPTSIQLFNFSTKTLVIGHRSSVNIIDSIPLRRIRHFVRNDKCRSFSLLSSLEHFCHSERMFLSFRTNVRNLNKSHLMMRFLVTSFPSE